MCVVVSVQVNWRASLDVVVAAEALDFKDVVFIMAGRCAVGVSPTLSPDNHTNASKAGRVQTDNVCFSGGMAQCGDSHDMSVIVVGES